MAHGYKEVNGEVIYVTPNSQSISVCLVQDGDPDKVARMLNFAVEKGYGERRRVRRKRRKDAGRSRGPQQKTLDRRREEAFQGSLEGVILAKDQDHCPCGSAYVISGGGGRRRCKAGSRAYSTAYQTSICHLTNEPAYKQALAASTQKQRDRSALAGRGARAKLGCQTGTARPGD